MSPKHPRNNQLFPLISRPVLAVEKQMEAIKIREKKIKWVFLPAASQTPTIHCHALFFCALNQ